MSQFVSAREQKHPGDFTRKSVVGADNHEFGRTSDWFYLSLSMQRDHDIAPALALTTPAGPRGPDLRWLIRSHADPQGFAAALFGLLAAVAEPGPKSRLASAYDLYHDMVARHLGGGRPALRVHDARAMPERRWRTLSYDELHRRCSRRAAAWAEQGVEPGAKLCVVQPFGEDCVVSLLTALRLGACVTLLEPGGPDYLARRLAALAPDYIATERFFLPLLGEPEPAPTLFVDDAEPEPRRSVGSHSYAPDEPCGLWLSPLRRPPELPVGLTAEACYRGAARDGADALLLRPDDTLAAPGFDGPQHQPALLFAALIMGASFVCLDEAAVVREPGLLTELPLRSLGVTAQVREALLDAAIARPRWAHVFRKLEEPCDWEAWRDFVELLGLEDTPCSSLLFETASGGCLLASARRPGREQLAHLMDVAPAPGRAWTLLDFSGSGQATIADVGVFAPLEGVCEPDDEGTPVEPCHVVLGRRRGPEFLYGGTVEPRRCGQVYPVDEVLEALADCPFLEAASVVVVPSGGATVAWRFVLLGFTGAEATDHFAALEQPRIEELRRVLETRLCAELLPDHVELFAYHARRRDGQVDHEWCRTQYLTGLLARKLRAPVFRRLSELRRALGA